MTISNLLDRLHQQPLEINQSGNRLYRLFWSAERYVVDFAEDFTSLGWQQFDTDQDAWYFGVWVNPRTHQVLTYAEGDWDLVDGDGKEGYNAEIKRMIEFYGEGEVAKEIDFTTNTITIHRQDRAQFLLP